MLNGGCENENMRWYWVLQWDNSASIPYCSAVGDLKGFKEVDIGAGTPINNWNPEAWIKATQPGADGIADDVLQNHLGLKIYSEKLRTILQIGNITGIQYLPVRVLRRSGEEIHGYAIANILNQPGAMDLERSGYSVFKSDDPMPERIGLVSGVYKMVLKRSALLSFDIVVPKEYPVSTYVSEKFKKIFEASRCTGYGFKEVLLSPGAPGRD